MRAKWLEERKNGIGGSDAAAIMGVSPYMDTITLWEIKTGKRQEPEVSNPYVQYGIEAEAHIAALFALNNPTLFVHTSEYEILTHAEYGFICGTLDGEFTDTEGNKGVLEVKTSRILSGQMRAKWDNRIPQHYYIQILHYLLVTGYKMAALQAYLLTNLDNRNVMGETREYWIDADTIKDDLDSLLERELWFWRFVETDTKPPIILPKL